MVVQIDEPGVDVATGLDVDRTGVAGGRRGADGTHGLDDPTLVEVSGAVFDDRGGRIKRHDPAGQDAARTLRPLP